MKLFDKHSSLKTIYYRSFVILIVVPILLVFLASLSIARHMVRRAAISNIQNSQEGIRTTLYEAVQETSLQLSHLVFVNDSEMLSLAAGMNQSDTALRYANSLRLDELLRMSSVPSQNTLSAMFLMKDGGSIYSKEEILLPRDEIEQKDWYQEALLSKDSVKVGIFDSSSRNLTYSRRKKGECILGAALSPSTRTDRSDQIEMVMLFTITPVGDLISRYNRDPFFGTTFLADADGTLLFAGEKQAEAAVFLEEMLRAGWEREAGEETLRMDDPQTGRSQKYTIIQTEVGEHGWKIVTCVRTGNLTQDYTRIAALLFGVVGILLLLFYLFSRFFLRSIIVPVHTLVEGMKELEDGNLETHVDPAGQSEIRVLIHSFNQMVRRLKATITENQQVQQKKHEAEVQALQSQINPHFLVNTLNSIRFMAQVSRFDGIRRMAEALIKILSCSFRGNISFYTVREELDVLDSYLYLMKIRYSNGFEAAYQVDESCLDCKIPRLILQPIVENSIVHGLSEKEEDIGHLLISGEKRDGFLYLTVEDDGSGMSREEIQALLRPKESRKDNSSIGIENVFTRLKLYFGEDCSLDIDSEPGKFTRTRIRMPAIMGESESEQSPDCR